MSNQQLDDRGQRISYTTRQRFWKSLESPAVVHLLLGFAVFTVVMPISWEIVTSFKTNEAVYNLAYLPEDPTLATFEQVLINQQYWKAILNSLIISGATTVIVLTFATLSGYGFSRYRFPFDSLLFIIIIVTRLFPPIGLIVPYYRVMAEFNLLNTFPGIIIAEVYLWLPLMVYIMRNFFISIPNEFDESARVDGCTKFQAFRKVVLPLAKPGIAACGILTFLYTWREFLFAFIISSGLETMPISVAVYQFVGDVNVSWASMAAASVLAIIPALLVVVGFQRYIVSGLTAGGIKG